MPIRMYKVLFLCTNINKLNRSMHNKIVLCAYDYFCIPQRDVCCNTMINKGIEYGCIFFVVPGNELALLGMPYCEWLMLLTVK